jgi:hypothetical protein
MARLAATASSNVTLTANIFGHIIIQNCLTSLACGTARTHARDQTAGLAFTGSFPQRNLEFPVSLRFFIAIDGRATEAEQTANHWIKMTEHTQLSRCHAYLERTLCE